MADHSSITIELSNSSNKDNCYIPPLEAVEPLVQHMLEALYTITSILALIGNLTVIFVEIFGTQSANNLRKFLINLAVSDIIIGVFCVPFGYTDFMLGKWIWPNWLCPVAQFAQLLSVFVTGFTLTVIGIERYLATIYPFSRSFDWISHHTNCLLYLAWILGSIFSGSWMPNTGVVLDEHNNETYEDCRFDIDLTQTKSQIYMTTNFILTFALPLIVLVFSYTCITKRLLNDSMGGSDAPLRRNNPEGQSSKRGRTIRMMFAVVVLYGICWAPIKLFQISQRLFPNFILFLFCTKTQYYMFVTTYFVCHWLAMANSFVNPIIYSFMSKSFRDDLNRMWRRRPWLSESQRSIGNTRSNTLTTTVGTNSCRDMSMSSPSSSAPKMRVAFKNNGRNAHNNNQRSQKCEKENIMGNVACSSSQV